MRNRILIALIVLTAGLAAWCISYLSHCDMRLHEAAAHGDAETWLRQEFKLDATQMKAIGQLQAAYEEECAKHCADIAEAREALEQLEQGPADAAKLQAARALVTRREEICRSAIRGHLRKVAALMPAEQGQRYLSLLLPKVDAYEHKGAPDLRLEP